MDSMHMHENTAATEHIDHAHSLTSAIVPTFILLIIAYAVLFVAHGSVVVEQSLTFLWTLTNTSPPSTKRLQRYFYNPRSPPAY